MIFGWNLKNPKEGEAVSIHGSIYNAGVIPSGEASDGVTVGFIVNGELAKIVLLENILPGLENGIEISSGPILDAVSGNYIVTVIINYHDTLSHLRDNPENNIVQKRIQILDGTPSLVKYDVYQKYDSKTDKQQITIEGKITDIFQEKVSNQKVILDIGDIKESVTTDVNGEFSFKTSITFNDEPIKVSAHIEDDFSFPEQPQMILPLKMNNEQSALVIHTTSVTNDFENSTLEFAIFQDSYENLFKIMSTDEFDDQNMQIDDSFRTILPANHEYIVEIYLEGRFLDAFQDDFVESAIVKEEIIIPEYGQVKFRVLDESNESQSDVTVDNWIYSSITSEDGMTEWIEMLPTIIPSEPYVAKATLPDGSVIWSEPFLLESEEKKIITIIKGGLNQ